VRKALVSAPPRKSYLQLRAKLPALAVAALLLTLGFVTWFNPGPQAVTTEVRTGAGPRVVEVAHPRRWGALLCTSYAVGVEGRLESELNGLIGDIGQLAHALLSRVPSGLRSRVGIESP